MSVLASTPFKFLIGRSRKLFTVHAALIAHHSKPLDILVNGDMSEAKEGCALLDDVDEYTFVRFSQYAYTGDYVTADSDIVFDSSAITTTPITPDKASLGRVEYDGEESQPVADDEWGTFQSSKKVKKRGKAVMTWGGEEIAMPAVDAPQSKKSKLWDSFKSKAYSISGPAFQPRKNRESCEDYTEVFLCHARLYVFADKYDVGPLRWLSLHKLQRTLAEFTLYDERAGDIIDLMRYSYSNITCYAGSLDELRLLVIHYTACVVEDLARSVKFQLLLEEGGSLARDLVEQMLKRLD